MTPMIELIDDLASAHRGIEMATTLDEQEAAAAYWRDVKGEIGRCGYSENTVEQRALLVVMHGHCPCGVPLGDAFKALGRHPSCEQVSA